MAMEEEPVVLDNVVLKLNPTRTRCEVLITVAGSTSVVTSGLVKPYATHIKAVEEQLQSGSHLICLDPRACNASAGATARSRKAASNPEWFTADTLNRVIAFINSPGVLEHAAEVDAELRQLDEMLPSDRAGALDSHATGSNDGMSDCSDRGRSPSLPDGSRRAHSRTASPARSLVQNGLKAVVSTSPNDDNGELILRMRKTMEMRRGMLRRELGVAIARVQAGGFSDEVIAQLLSFADCFRAERLRRACESFMNLTAQREADQLEAAAEGARKPSECDRRPLSPSAQGGLHGAHGAHEMLQLVPLYGQYPGAPAIGYGLVNANGEVVPWGGVAGGGGDPMMLRGAFPRIGSTSDGMSVHMMPRSESGRSRCGKGSTEEQSGSNDDILSASASSRPRRYSGIGAGGYDSGRSRRLPRSRSLGRVSPNLQQGSPFSVGSDSSSMFDRDDDVITDSSMFHTSASDLAGMDMGSGSSSVGESSDLHGLYKHGGSPSWNSRRGSSGMGTVGKPKAEEEARYRARRDSGRDEREGGTGGNELKAFLQVLAKPRARSPGSLSARLSPSPSSGGSFTPSPTGASALSSPASGGQSVGTSPAPKAQVTRRFPCDQVSVGSISDWATVVASERAAAAAATASGAKGHGVQEGQKRSGEGGTGMDSVKSSLEFVAGKIVGLSEPPTPELKPSLSKGAREALGVSALTLEYKEAGGQASAPWRGDDLDPTVELALGQGTGRVAGEVVGNAMDLEMEMMGPAQSGSQKAVPTASEKSAKHGSDADTDGQGEVQSRDVRSRGGSRKAPLSSPRTGAASKRTSAGGGEKKPVGRSSVVSGSPTAGSGPRAGGARAKKVQDPALAEMERKQAAAAKRREEEKKKQEELRQQRLKKPGSLSRSTSAPTFPRTRSSGPLSGAAAAVAAGAASPPPSQFSNSAAPGTLAEETEDMSAAEASGEEATSAAKPARSASSAHGSSKGTVPSKSRGSAGAESSGTKAGAGVSNRVGTTRSSPGAAARPTSPARQGPTAAAARPASPSRRAAAALDSTGAKGGSSAAAAKGILKSRSVAGNVPATGTVHRGGLKKVDMATPQRKREKQEEAGGPAKKEKSDSGVSGDSGPQGDSGDVEMTSATGPELVASSLDDWRAFSAALKTGPERGSADSFAFDVIPSAAPAMGPEVTMADTSQEQNQRHHQAQRQQLEQHHQQQQPEFKQPQPKPRQHLNPRQLLMQGPQQGAPQQQRQAMQQPQQQRHLQQQQQQQQQQQVPAPQQGRAQPSPMQKRYPDKEAAAAAAAAPAEVTQQAAAAHQSANGYASLLQTTSLMPAGMAPADESSAGDRARQKKAHHSGSQGGFRDNPDDMAAFRQERLKKEREYIEKLRERESSLSAQGMMGPPDASTANAAAAATGVAAAGKSRVTLRRLFSFGK